MQTTGIQVTFRKDSSLLPQPHSLFHEEVTRFLPPSPSHLSFPSSAPTPNPQVLPLEEASSPTPHPAHGWIVAPWFSSRGPGDHSSSIFSGFAALLPSSWLWQFSALPVGTAERKKRESLVCPELRHTMISCLV